MDEDPQHVAIGDDPQHKDDTVKNREEGVSELRVHTRGIICLHRSGPDKAAGHCPACLHLEYHMRILINEGPTRGYLISSVPRILLCVFLKL